MHENIFLLVFAHLRGEILGLISWARGVNLAWVVITTEIDASERILPVGLERQIDFFLVIIREFGIGIGLFLTELLYRTIVMLFVDFDRLVAILDLIGIT